jgi:ABC-2 type transport system ATP-binding protein
MTAAVLEVDDLEKRYGTTIALDRIRFRVSAGEMFGLLGPNGAGKTTLLSILSCLLPASGGKAFILGREVVLSDLELRRHIGIVPQELAVYGELTARENLEFFGRLYGLAGEALRRRGREVLEGIGLADRAERRVETFSGGMKRRLNLGVALMHRPRLLMLDEPTTGVDPQSRNHIFEEVRRLNAEGTTVIYTSHYMEEVQALCTRIGIMDNGKLIACDTLPALLQQLPGMIRFRVPEVSTTLADQLRALPGVQVTAPDGDTVTLECADVKATLLRLLGTLNEQKVVLTSLETEEPNLERVFLHLTGHALRD